MMKDLFGTFVLAKLYAFSVSLLLVLGAFGVASYAQLEGDGDTITATDGVTAEVLPGEPPELRKPVDNYQEPVTVDSDAQHNEDPCFVSKMHQDYTEYDDVNRNRIDRTRVIWELSAPTGADRPTF
jgi:hypothetical protein